MVNPINKITKISPPLPTSRISRTTSQPVKPVDNSFANAGADPNRVSNTQEVHIIAYYDKNDELESVMAATGILSGIIIPEE